MKEIKLTKGQYALVDDEDFDYLNQWKWKFDSHGYASRTIYPKGKVYMHQLVNQTKKGFVTDHINQNKLDNRRNNLRTVTSSQNLHNSGISAKNTSGYKGISLMKGRNKWAVYIHINYKKINLGYFKDIKDAVIARREGEKLYLV